MHGHIEKLSHSFTETLGSSLAFYAACAIFAAWFFLGRYKTLFHQPSLFIAEACGLFIFLHLFLTQRHQNKSMKALHLKLDELIATMEGANNKLIKAEEAPEKVVDDLHKAYSDLAENVPHPTDSIKADTSPLEEEEIHRGP